MEMWLGEHWFDLFQVIILGGGFLATLGTLNSDVNVRKVQNLFTLTAANREIWSALYDRPHLNRVLESNPDLKHHPITPEEELFVHFLILHLRTSFKARQLGLEFDDDNVGADIHDFFTRPIPKEVWNNSKKFQDAAFVSFVESHLR